MIIGTGSNEGLLTNNELHEVVYEGLNSLTLDGKRVLVLIPDRTRTMPMPMVYDLFEEILHHRVKNLDYLVALGTHQPLNDFQLSQLVGRGVVGGNAGNSRIFNHEWHKPETFSRIGTIPSKEIKLITDGLLIQDVPIHVNKLVYNYDQIIICGPVFPHEVAGFSGGNKYFFPGIAGPEIINFTHWLGAVITNYRVIGTANTPVRIVIDRASEFIKVPTACFAFVVNHQGVAGLYFGPTKEAWKAAAKLSGVRHIIYKENPFNRVLSVMPEMYEDLWTAAKGMYKLEPIVADGGEIIIYAPHVHEVSYTHGTLIDELGYHCRDYYLEQWDRFKGYPGGVLAHSTHLKGLGNYDPRTGIENARIIVTLATGIPAERCNRINLRYQNPAEIDYQEWQNREAEGILVVPSAGEMLYRIK
jgi:nickel-dependent lactate racemase